MLEAAHADLVQSSTWSAATFSTSPPIRPAPIPHLPKMDQE